MDAILRHMIRSLVAEESAEFNRIRLEIERHAAGLRGGDRAFTVERREDLMPASQCMATFFFASQRLVDDLFFARHSKLLLGDHRVLGVMATVAAGRTF